MNRSERTYMKREVKKALPVLIIGILYTVAVFAIVFQRMKDICLDGYLAFSFPYYFSGREYGDCFIHEWVWFMEKFHPYVIIFMEALLIRRIFYQENRAGISDFLRTLPVKEWKKTWIKVGVGEAVIFVFCLVYGLAATVVYSIYGDRLNEINSMIPGASVSGNTYFMIGQIVLLMFVGMSVMFLILFAAQLYIHNLVAAYIVGVGVLVTPAYFTYIYGVLYGPARGLGIWTIPASVIASFPALDIQILNSGTDAITMIKYIARWDGYSQKLLFLLLFFLLAVAVILLALKKRWNVWESNNALVNSKVVMEFIFTGISLGFGTVVVMALDDVMGWYLQSGAEEFLFWLYSVIVAGIILLFLNGTMIVLDREKRKRYKK